MKKFYLLLSVLLLSVIAFSQESWTVSLNGKTVLRSASFGAEKNLVRFRRSALPKKGTLLVSFTENNPQKEWDRYLGLYDDTDNELLVIKGTRLSLSNPKLRSLLKAGKTYKVLTWSLPTDPDLRSRIRIQRLELARLVVE